MRIVKYVRETQTSSILKKLCESNGRFPIYDDFSKHHFNSGDKVLLFSITAWSEQEIWLLDLPFGLS